MANRFPESIIIILPNPKPVSVRGDIIPCDSMLSQGIFEDINYISRAVNFLDI